MAVEREEQISVEARKQRLIDFARRSIQEEPETMTSYYNNAPDDKIYTLYWPQNHSQIEVWPDKLKIEKRQWNGHMMEVVKAEIGESIRFEDNIKQVRLTGEEALSITEERIHDFIPPRILAVPL